MMNVADKLTTNDILDKADCHRTTVLRMAEKLGIVPGRIGNVFLFSKDEAKQIIEAIKSRQLGKRSN